MTVTAECPPAYSTSRREKGEALGRRTFFCFTTIDSTRVLVCVGVHVGVGVLFCWGGFFGGVAFMFSSRGNELVFFFSRAAAAAAEKSNTVLGTADIT